MTNEEKVKNMTKDFLKQELIKKSRLQELLIKAMQWKDEQFKGFLFELALKITTPKTDLDKALVSAFPMAGLNTVDDILTSLQNDWCDYQDKGTILNR